MEYDIVIIGGGQAGLSFAASLMDTSLSIAVIEKRELSLLSEPKPDGREIALTHLSVDILKKLAVWQLIPEEVICPLKEARVFDGESSSYLDFTSQNKEKNELGYLIPNYKICHALYQRVSTADNVELLTQQSVADVTRQADYSTIHLENGDTITTKLVIAADSRFSTIRKKMGIPALMQDFSKVMIVAQMDHQQSHQNIALECFHYERTLALLPMVGNSSSVVITVATDKVDAVMKQDEAAFNQDMTQAFRGELGEMTLQGERHCYPLMGVYSQQLVSHRFALIGDAAVGMHPVTAQGANLGLRGQDILAAEIKKSVRRGTDIGSLAVLKGYERKQINMNRMMYFGTNGVVALFTNDTPMAKKIRKTLLAVVKHFPPVKHLISHHLTNTSSGIRKFLPF